MKRERLEEIKTVINIGYVYGSKSLPGSTGTGRYSCSVNGHRLEQVFNTQDEARAYLIKYLDREMELTIAGLLRQLKYVKSFREDAEWVKKCRTPQDQE